MTGHRAERRRRRLAAIGDTSTERSADDTDRGWSEPGGDGAQPDGAEHQDTQADEMQRDEMQGDEMRRDDELRREVPPHHG